MRLKADLLHRCELLDNQEVAPAVHLLKLRRPRGFTALPGQFIHLRLGPATDPLLRRPISIHFCDEENNEIHLLIRLAGRGTTMVAALAPGEVIDIIGPLGKGFPYFQERGSPLLVAGGIGLAPLYYLALQRRWERLSDEFLIGAATSAALPPETYFAAVGLKPVYATEDGSRGRTGLVTELLEEVLRTGNKPSRIYTCGPLAMMAGVVRMGQAYRVPVHVSLESHMACGVGACLGCAFPFKKEQGKTGDEALEYRRVCVDGPVFNGEEVYFEHC